jgi:DNA ligase-associated metallophosphoesterase
MIINFGNAEFLLHKMGVLYWPAQKMLIVSDLHLEKGSHQAQRGYFLPPYDTNETLTRLLRLCDEIRPKTIILLGDCFHDAKGFSRMKPEDQRLLGELRLYDCIWIKGNHDGDYVPDGLISYEEFVHEGIAFRHEATSAPTGFEVSGHFHPKIDILHKGRYTSHACFVQGERKLILPSFGAYTGGLSIADKAINVHFPDGCVCHALGGSKVYTIDAIKMASALR